MMTETMIHSIERTHFERTIQEFMKTEMAGEFEDCKGHIEYTVSDDNTTFTMTAQHGFRMSNGKRVHSGDQVTFDAQFNIT